MALSVELRGPRGDVLPVSSLSLTETPNEGWRWQVSLPYIPHNYTVYTGDTPCENCYGNGTVSLLEAFLPHLTWFLTVSDGVNTLPLPRLVATDISETPAGGEASGIDWVFYWLTSQVLDVSHMINDVGWHLAHPVLSGAPCVKSRRCSTQAEAVRAWRHSQSL